MLEGEDVLHTADVMQALGARVERTGDRAWRVYGVGIAGFAQPTRRLDFGNSGTGAMTCCCSTSMADAPR